MTGVRKKKLSKSVDKRQRYCVTIFYISDNAEIKTAYGETGSFLVADCFLTLASVNSPVFRDAANSLNVVRNSEPEAPIQRRLSLQH